MSPAARAAPRGSPPIATCNRRCRRQAAPRRAGVAAHKHRAHAARAGRARQPARVLKGFCAGGALSAAAAASIAFIVLRQDRDGRILGEAISAHLRSLQAEHLTDVLSSDQHTVKPWFNGRSTSPRR